MAIGFTAVALAAVSIPSRAGTNPCAVFDKVSAAYSTRLAGLVSATGEVEVVRNAIFPDGQTNHYQYVASFKCQRGHSICKNLTSIHFDEKANVLLTPDRVYEYIPSLSRLEIRKRREREEWFYVAVTPELLLGLRRRIEDYLSYFLRAEELTLARANSQNYTIIATHRDARDGHGLMSVDAELGVMKRFVGSSSTVEHSEILEWDQIDGVLFARSMEMVTHPSGQIRDELRVRIRSVSFNVPLSMEEFEPSALGVKEGDSVFDHESRARYPWREKKLQAAPVEN